MSSAERLDYVVGEEKRLSDILSEAELSPLFLGAVHAGAEYVCLHGEQGEELCHVAGNPQTAALKCSRAITIEGEPAGLLVISGSKELLAVLDALLVQVVQAMVQANLKRMLTTEMHTKVVNQSWDELLEANRQLTASEARYKELAEILEVKVVERTAELKQAQVTMLEREKMAAIGQLAAGIAHEINNPMGFVTSNVYTLEKYVSRLVEMLDCSGKMISRDATAVEEFATRRRDLKIERIVADLPVLFKETLDGAERVRRIVADLKGFSHVDEIGEAEVLLTDEIDRTLNVLAHEIPNDTRIVKNYGALPPFRCRPHLICQVFLNLIQNALQFRPEGLVLEIGASLAGEKIMITIADNGPGVPNEIKGRIFEPFFTTKQVGAGTGLGLAVVYDIVTQHGGTVSIGEAALGGAIFTIAFPRAIPSN